MELQEKTVLIGDYRISYLDNEKADAPILVFVHGWGADKYNLQSIYNPLINKYRIISLDLPGFGKSSQPVETIGSIEYAQILKSFLNELNINSINYIGHSFGGKIGIILSAQNDNLINRLVLIDSAGIRSKHNLIWHIKVVHFKLLKFFYLSIIKNKNKLEEFKSKFGSDDYKNAGNMRNILVKSVNEDFTHLLNKIKCPVFLYWGENDKDTPLWMAKKMKKMIKDCALYTVKNGGHFSFTDDNRIINIIDAFVK
jgi:pimeloyl-ACP methyl ester carboxylesterase